MDADWVPFEIEKAADVYGIPIIAAYTFVEAPIRNPRSWSSYWPLALRVRIDNQTAKVLHIPFKKDPIKDSLRFTHENPPAGNGLGIYSDEAYRFFGIPG